LTEINAPEFRDSELRLGGAWRSAVQL